MLVYRLGYYEPSYELKKYVTQKELLEAVNKLNSAEEVLILFAGEIKEEFDLQPEEVVTRFKIA